MMEVMTRRLTTADALTLIRPSIDRLFVLDHPNLADRLEAEQGFSIERVGDLYRQAGGERWKSSVAETDVSTCARALLFWLAHKGLEIYSHQALLVAREGNGTVMTRGVLRQLKAGDMVVVVDPSLERGALLSSGRLQPEVQLDWPNLPEPDALDQRIRVANARDAAGVSAMRTWSPSWQF